MFDLPEHTNVAVGLATKPYPHFRLPGWGKFSVAWHSNGDKCHNFPFNATPYGGQIKEGDVIGIGFGPGMAQYFLLATAANQKMRTPVSLDGICSLLLVPMVLAVSTSTLDKQALFISKQM